MATISDIFNKPTPFQSMLGRDMALMGGFGPEGGPFEKGNSQLRFMGGAGRKARQAGAFAKAGKWGLVDKALGGTAARGALPLFGLYSAASAGVSGYKEGGITGAAKGVATEALWWGASTVAMRGLAAVGGAALAHPVTATAVVGTAVLGGGALYAGYRGMESSWQYHLKSLPLETTGSMEAFATGGAATMRQRSMMNIQRSHLNARSAFGNEAQWAHIAKYRGVGRRGLM